MRDLRFSLFISLSFDVLSSIHVDFCFIQAREAQAFKEYSQKCDWIYANFVKFLWTDKLD